MSGRDNNRERTKPDENAARAFAELILERMESLSSDWTQPWINAKATGLLESLEGRRYSNGNSFFLSLLCARNGYETPVFLTYPGAKRNGLLIKKGERAFPVIYYNYTVKDRETGRKIPIDSWRELPDSEKVRYKVTPFMRTHPVFNLDQTDIREARPELWDKVRDRFKVDIPFDGTGMASCPAMDLMLERRGWLCPIYQERGNEACYLPDTDEIHVPLKTQFKDGESFYSTLAHEMAHSTGNQNRLGRISGETGGGREDYGREELVAELTAAIAMASLGISTSPRVENIAYLKGWCEDIQKEPRFILTTLSDVSKATAMILDVTDKYRLVLEERAKEGSKREDIRKTGYISMDGTQLEIRFMEEPDRASQDSLIERLKERVPGPKEPGDFSLVERVFTDLKHFEFTSGAEIKTPEDVAYIFKNLEDASIENSFAVLVKDGAPVVTHLGMGTSTGANVDVMALKVAVDRLRPDKVYFVHNHPSGSLSASNTDIKTWERLREIIGTALQPGIIINLKSGRFALFGGGINDRSRRVERKDREIPVRVLSFSRQVFDPSYDFENNTSVRGPEDIAAFISSHRLGDRKKISALILNSSMGVVANALLPYAEVKPENVERMANELVGMITLHGGTRMILYGDFPLTPAIRTLEERVRFFSFDCYRLLDSIALRGNNSEYVCMTEKFCLAERNEAYIPGRDKNNIINDKTSISMEQAIKRVDISRIDWGIIESRFGITRDTLERNGVLDDMLNLKKSATLLPVRYESASGQREFMARVAFTEKDGGYTLRFYPAKDKPELDRPYMGYSFSPEDREALLQTGHLGKVVRLQPYRGNKMEAFISLDPLTNDILHVDKERVRLTETICGATITPEQRLALMEGKTIFLKGMVSPRTGNTFGAYLRVDANKGGLGFVNPPKKEVDIDKVTDILRVPIDEGQRRELKNGGGLDLSGLRARDGRSFSARVYFNPDRKTFKYDFPDKKKEDNRLREERPEDIPQQKENKREESGPEQGIPRKGRKI